jgi:hypothetical protein
MHFPLLEGTKGYIPVMSKARILIVILICLSLAAGTFIGTLLGRIISPTGTTKSYSTAALLKEVQSLSELVTVKYVIEKVVVVEDVKWYGENRVLLLAHGVVKGGVDLKRLQADAIVVADRKVSIKLPPAQVLDTYLDESKTQVIERSTGLLRAFDKDLEQNARRNATDDIARAARVSGLKEEASERARAQLKSLFLQLGFEEVEFH